MAQSTGHQKAALVRHHGADSAVALRASRDHAAASIARAIERALASAPPLSDEQAERLSELLRGGAE